MDFISFGNYNYEKIDEELIIRYENRLKIDSKFEELGVVILNQPFKDSFLEEIKNIASSKGANGIIIEGKNAVLLKVEKLKNNKDKESEAAI